ncbi:hypothetical protein HX837_07595, partial [Marine Group I thaumarchaeote]|nr:hypothetical protein [Marine Group I thaumarchaeote]
MAYSYTRQSSMSDGDTITAALFNNEYNQLVNAFAYHSSTVGSTGHRHDGTAGHGGSIHTIGDLDFLNKIAAGNTNNRWGVFVEVSSAAVEQIRIQDGVIAPVTDNDIDLGTSSLEFKDLFIDGTAHIDTLDVDVNGTVAGTFGVTGATTLSSTLAVTGAVTGSSTFQGTTITATTAFVPDASDGAALGTSALEFSDLFLADGAVINFGDDQDVSLTHVADTGILLSSTDQLQFGDSGTYIYQSADGVLELVSDTEIELTATTIDINGAVAMDGAITGGTNITISGELDAATLDISGNADIDGTTNLDNTDIDGTLAVDGTTISLDASTSLNIDNSNTSNGITIGTVTSGVPISIGHTTSETTVNDNLTVTGTLTLGSGAELTEAELEFLDGITAGTVAASKAVVVDSNKDIGTFRNVTIDGTFSDGNYTFDTSGNVSGLGTIGSGAITSTGTVQGTTITATTAFVPDASDGAALGTSALEFSDLFLADGAVINFGDDQDVSLTHVADTGLLISSTDQLQFGDSGTYIYQSADGVLDLVSDTEIELTATTIDINGNVDVSGTLTVAGAVDFGDAALSNVGAVQLDSIAGDGDTNTSITFSGSDVITIATGGSGRLTIGDGALSPVTNNQMDLGTSSLEFKDAFFDGTVTADAFAGPLTGNVTGNASGTALTVTQAAQTNITSLGTLTALTVDDVAINGKVVTMTGSTDDTATVTVGTNGTLAITTVDTAAAAANMTLTADGTFEAVGTTITLDSGGAINLEPASGSAILLDGTISVDAGVVTGATSITSTAFVGDITGDVTGNASGTALTVTQAAQTNITSLGTLTALTVDDVAINGKVVTMTGSSSDTAVFTAGTNGTLSIVTTDDAAAAANIQITADGTVDIDSAGILTLDSGAAINIEPAAGSAILLDGTISVDAGVVTGATAITLSGELDAGSLDVSGDADIDGTLEADVITVDGTALNEYIADTVGAMVGSNTESGITVAYQDGDNTLDFTVGTLNQDTSGTAAIATTVTITDNESTNESNAVIFTAGGDVDGGNLGLESDGNLTYNPSSGTLTATAFAGALTGNVTGNTSGTAATVTTAAQSNITSLGTLTTLTVDNVIINGSTIGHTGDTDLITVASGIATVAGEVSMTTLDIGGTNVTSTAAELNILDGVTSTAAELNILDGVTSTAAELN